MQAQAKLGNPVLRGLAVLLTAALLLAGLTSAAAADNGGGTAGNGKAPHRKCKKKPAGRDKANANKHRKCHRKKHKPITPAPVTPPPPVVPPVTPPVTPPTTTTLAISPPSFDFGEVEHGGTCGAEPDPNCPTQTFTVANTGAATSGVPTASIVEIQNPEVGGPPAFAITTNTCTAALAPGASCNITVRFHPNSNAGDEMYSSRLEVTASPGSTASSLLSGIGS